MYFTRTPKPKISRAIGNLQGKPLYWRCVSNYFGVYCVGHGDTPSLAYDNWLDNYRRLDD